MLYSYFWQFSELAHGLLQFQSSCRNWLSRSNNSIKTSLGVIAIAAISATLGHAERGNALWAVGFILGAGGLLGAQVSTRFLPRLSDRTVSLAFRSLLALLSVYVFWQAWQQFTQKYI